MSASPSFPRAGITAPDADASQLGTVVVAPAQSIRLGATCSIGGATIGLSVYFLDPGGQPITVQRLQFTSQGTADWGLLFVGTPTYDSCWPLSGAKEVVVKVDSVSTGSTWSIDGTVS